VLDVPHALREPQILARDMMTEFYGIEELGAPLTVVRGGFLVDGEAPRPVRRPPRLGEHTDEILAEAELRRNGAET
jgi:crotonobetainyl-CoA:carnitine CoA-transferase CaiB-like acyl-CoA transferase